MSRFCGVNNRRADLPPERLPPKQNCTESVFLLKFLGSAEFNFTTKKCSLWFDLTSILDGRASRKFRKIFQIRFSTPLKLTGDCDRRATFPLGNEPAAVKVESKRQ